MDRGLPSALSGTGSRLQAPDDSQAGRIKLLKEKVKIDIHVHVQGTKRKIECSSQDLRDGGAHKGTLEGVPWNSHDKISVFTVPNNSTESAPRLRNTLMMRTQAPAPVPLD